MNQVARRQAHRERRDALDAAMQATGQTVELLVEHHFSNFTYTRELFMPAGTVLTGKIHRFECTNILSKGRVLVATEDGLVEIEAPCTFVTGPGISKVMTALEDSVFINVHPWDGYSTVEQIERQLIVPSYEALEQENRQ